MDHVSIRQLDQMDTKKAVSVIDAAFSGHFTEGARVAFQNLDNLELFGAFYDKQMVGVVGVCPAGFLMNAYGICWISVLPEYQGQGIGGRMIQHAIDVIKNKEPSIPLMIFLAVPASKYYTKFGFELTGFTAVDGSSLMAMTV